MVNTMLAAALQQEPSIDLISLLGIANVFIGLICLVSIMKIKNTVSALSERKEDFQPQEAVAPVMNTAPAIAYEQPIENRQEIIAAVCAAVAEENGTDISAIRVVSFKKL